MLPPLSSGGPADASSPPSALPLEVSGPMSVAHLPDLVERAELERFVRVDRRPDVLAVIRLLYFLERHKVIRLWSIEWFVKKTRKLYKTFTLTYS